MKTYITLPKLAEKLGFTSKSARVSAYKWVVRRNIPKKWRGNCWLVAEEDVQASLDGKSFVRSQLRAAS